MKAPMPTAASPRSSRWRSVLVWAAVVGALLAVAQAYLSPHLVVDLANRVWSCF